jgi:hypothetical protein
MREKIDLAEAFGKKMVVPDFVYGTKDLDRGPLVGTCRGYGAMLKVTKHQAIIGIYTDQGVYYNIKIDTRVISDTPQFIINDQAFFYSIVGYYTMCKGDPCIDPKTGYLLINN